MNTFRKYLPFALFAGFLLFGLNAFMQSRPAPKNTRIYTEVQHFSPYFLDKRFGGLEIRSKTDPDFKEKPNNMTLFQEFERLEREWGKQHLKLQKNTLLILDDNGTVQKEVPLQNKAELDFIHRYYRIGS